MSESSNNLKAIRTALLQMHNTIRDSVVSACEQQSVAALSEVAHDDEGDTIYAIDKVSEELLVEHVDKLARSLEVVIVLVGEGLPDGKVTLPKDANEDDAAYRIIVDPIDGTRCIMTQKRPAWILTGVASNRGPDTSLSDIELAIQTEIPLVKQHLCDQYWATRESDVTAQRLNRLTGEVTSFRVGPSQASGFEHGCVSVARFFPGARDILAGIDDQLASALLGPQPEGKALCFEDQYPSTGGQLCELFTGRDRFIADLRPLLRPTLSQRGLPTGLCCHPYDLCIMLIAERAGVILTDADGRPLDAPLDVHADVAWVGYANQTLRERVEPALQNILRERGLI